MSSTSAFRRLPVTTSVGAVLEGVDITWPLPPETGAFIRKCLVEHGVVFFRDQDMTVEQFWSFMQNFGTPMVDEISGTPQDTAAMTMARDLMPARHATAVWHADTTSLAKPPWATGLRAIEPTPCGGDTCWSSMYAAWEGLSEPMRRMLDGLTAVHSIQPTYDRMGQYAMGFRAQYEPRHAPEQIHPVALTHPETGRKALNVNESFTTRIVELAPAESAAVLSMLFRHVEKPDFCMRWKWSANDVAIWDNRAVQHYAVPDYQSRRVMQRIVLQG